KTAAGHAFGPAADELAGGVARGLPGQTSAPRNDSDGDRPTGGGRRKCVAVAAAVLSRAASGRPAAAVDRSRVELCKPGKAGANRRQIRCGGGGRADRDAGGW